jgi:hypothetical protein
MDWLKGYILQGQTPVPCDDLLVWSTWCESADRRVGFTKIGRLTVSTVFLGLDHRFAASESELPILFETMVFGGGTQFAEFQMRYCTWEDAESGHQAIVQLVKVDRRRQNKKAFKQLLKRLANRHAQF